MPKCGAHKCPCAGSIKMENHSLWLCRYHARLPFMRDWPKLTDYLKSLENDFSAVKEMFLLGSAFRQEAVKMQDLLDLNIAKQVSYLNQLAKKSVKISNAGIAVNETERAKHIVEVFQKRNKVDFGAWNGTGTESGNNQKTT